MKTFKIIFVSVVTLAITAAAFYILMGYLAPKPSGLIVDTTPDSNVYINGDLVGKTPYQNTFKSKSVDLRLVPLVSDQNLLPYETKVNLVSGIQTVVRREFGTTEGNSSGDVISFERTANGQAGISIVSTPGSAEVFLDSVTQGFAPYTVDSVKPGTHEVTVQAPGYVSRSMSVKAQAGYNLTVFAKLAVATNPQPSSTPSPTPQVSNKTYVVISENLPNGFLRMRTQAGTAGEEIAQLKSGDKYLYLDTDPGTGWYKIQYQDPAPGLPNGIVGWVSNQYSSIASGSASLSK